MNCNCTKACSIPYCITELEIGIVEPGLTGLIVQITDIITGRVKKLTDIAPQSDGLLIVDVEDINAFFSPNFEYEIKVLFSDESGCQTVPITVGDQTVDCIKVSFVSGESTKGVIVLEGQVSQYMTLEGDFNDFLAFTPLFNDGRFVIYWGDTTENVMNNNMSNVHTYSPIGEYTAKIRGDFEHMQAIGTGNTGTRLTNVVMPPVNAFNNLVLRSNRLPVSVINNILQNLDQNGVTNGLLSLQNQTPPATPDGVGAVAKSNLIAKGWSVTTD